MEEEREIKINREIERQRQKDRKTERRREHVWNLFHYLSRLNLFIRTEKSNMYAKRIYI